MNLQQWVERIEQAHPADIELGLERISLVAKQLSLPWHGAKVVLVAGTNGKGTNVAVLEQIALRNHFNTFSYTSPHVLNFNERIRVNGSPVNDDALIESFKVIESARKQTPLTFFEFTTLAAMWLESQFKPEISIYEVGLGGRLDATNIHDPDLCLVTSLGFDHMDWLGHSLAEIAYEKASIVRSNRPMVFGDTGFPEKAYEVVSQNQGKLFEISQDFHYELEDFSTEIAYSSQRLFSYQGLSEKIQFDCPSFVHPKNLASSCFVAEKLFGIDLSSKMMHEVVNHLFLPGRFQAHPNFSKIRLDVSHNPQAILSLTERIQSLESPILLICGMLQDKLQQGFLDGMSHLNVEWALADLPGKRGALARQLEGYLPQNHQVSTFSSIENALAWALEIPQKYANIVVFGSFVTVALATAYLNSLNPQVEKASI